VGAVGENVGVVRGETAGIEVSLEGA